MFDITDQSQFVIVRIGDLVISVDSVPQSVTERPVACSREDGRTQGTFWHLIGHGIVTLSQAGTISGDVKSNGDPVTPFGPLLNRYLEAVRIA
jgi:hypothetical protein